MKPENILFLIFLLVLGIGVWGEKHTGRRRQNTGESHTGNKNNLESVTAAPEQIKKSN